MKTKKKERVTNPYEEIKKDLEKQKEALLADAGVILGSGLNQGNETLTDLGDQASAEADQNFILRLREREQKLLKKIDEAIDRINEGTFGVCESCGGQISVKRLKARPVTTLCIDCKTKQEAEEKSGSRKILPLEISSGPIPSLAAQPFRNTRL
ncbi:MAG: TraR/DksA C4-type zinc finger protein [Candidatus Manganitrophus sp.]|nr:MAG: TraR/DksA C4-type zinc finger protein [Candidatus Manganitrophus sp.]